MITLALDTTGAAGSIAVCRDGVVVAEEAGDESRPHGQRLPGEALAVLARAGLSVDAVDLFAVAAGPGAFTGLRIGIAAVQGFAFARRRPAVGISALDAYAHLAITTGRPEPGSLVGVWIDAARDEVFAALYEVPAGAPALEDAVPECLVPATVGTPDTVLARWQGIREGRPLRWAGSGVERYAAAIERARGDRPVADRLPPLARGIAVLGAAAHRAGRSGLPHAIQPIYVRRPDAELARDRRAAVAGPRSG
jgi:tRNA threonylcarbamoyladenosine biosynthesis protein TsaB